MAALYAKYLLDAYLIKNFRQSPKGLLTYMKFWESELEWKQAIMEWACLRINVP